MNLKIYKKICELVRIEEIKDDEGYVTLYLVQSRKTKKREWETIFESSSLKKTLLKKHFQILIVIKELGHRQDLLNKRKKQRGY